MATKNFITNAMVPVEHLFNDHSFFDAAWSWSKDVEENVDKILFKKLKSKVRQLV